MSFQIYWPNWWKIWPSYSRTQNDNYKHLYPNIQLYHCFFCLSIFQWKWYTFIPPLMRSKEWARKIKKLLLEELTSIAHRDRH